jgi:hypothetical protein
MNQPRQRRFQFTMRHLLWLTALVALAITGLGLAIDYLGFTETDVEILKVHDSGTVEYLVHLPNGFFQSGVSIPAGTSPEDFEKLVGMKFKIRHRDGLTLWKSPENIILVSYERVQSLVDDCAKEKHKN